MLGPWSLQGEYMLSNVNRESGSDPLFSGWYALATYYTLTGEARPYSAASGTFSARIRAIRSAPVASASGCSACA